MPDDCQHESAGRMFRGGATVLTCKSCGLSGDELLRDLRRQRDQAIYGREQLAEQMMAERGQWERRVEALQDGTAIPAAKLRVAQVEALLEKASFEAAELEARAKRAEAAVKRICEIGARGGWCAVDSENWPCLAPRPLPEGSCLACWLSVADGGPSGIVATCPAEADRRIAEGKGGSE